MPQSVWEKDVQATLDSAKLQTNRQITLDGQNVEVSSPFPSPEDWRDQWIYFLMIDRFNNPLAPPRQLPYNSIFGGFQGGTFNGVRAQLAYLKELGVGAIWLSPVIKNAQYSEGSYHGYGIQNFLSIEPRFASSPAMAERELRALIDEAHALGIYIIFDIVLNHVGDLFAYQCNSADKLCLSAEGSLAEFSETAYAVMWRDEHGASRTDWPIAEAIKDPPLDATVWPAELRDNAFFRRQGLPQAGGSETIGDFASLKQMLTGNTQLQSVLIRSYQYLIAKFDIDGFRIDTLKYISVDFARTFGNAVREFGLSIGKKNFFTYGEVYDSEEKIAQFIGRNTMTTEAGDAIGVDAALDFPLFYNLPGVCKGLQAPSNVVNMFQARKQVERDILSTHGDASNFFVTFLDNHDQYTRFYYRDPMNAEEFDDQVTLAVGCLFSLPGIPCLYYGTEQGLSGSGNSLEAVREALWGKPGAFDQNSLFYRGIAQIATLRNNSPVLRYGRHYFRPLSTDDIHFGISTTAPGVLAFSRILNDSEFVIVANTNTQNGWIGEVIVDFTLNPKNSAYRVLFSNKAEFVAPGSIAEKPAGSIEITEVDGSITAGPARVLPVNLKPMEIQILEMQSP